MNMSIPKNHSIPDSRSAFWRRGLIAVAATSVGFSMLCIASSEPPAAQPAVVAATGRSPYATDPRDSQVAIIEELSFPGGTVKQYVDAIEAAIKPVPLNVVYVDRGEQALVQAVRLRRVAASSALRLLFGPLTAGAVSVEFSAGSGSGDVGVFVIRGESNPVDAGLRSAMSTRVFSLREWTIAATPDDVATADSRRAAALGAIEEGLSLSADSKTGPHIKPTVRYHAGSGLLFVLANEDDHRVAESIVRQLEESFRVAENSKKDSGRLQAMAQKIAGLQHELNEARSKLDAKNAPEPTTLLVPMAEAIQPRAIAIVSETLSKDSVVAGTTLQMTPGQLGVEVRGDPDRVARARAALLAAAVAIGEPGAGQQTKP